VDLGSGRYRSSDVYLSVMPLNFIEAREGIRYFAGDAGQPFWSDNENDAAALFCAGDVGELSVRWNPFLARYLCLFNSENPLGIHMHTAKRPWGPWSERPVMVFDPGFREDPNDPCSGAGYGRFMHIPWNVALCDHVQDDMFTPGSFRDNEWGGGYGPYQITRFTSGVRGRSSNLYFVMSTWNPYSVMLMTTTITADLL
jgi:uncharacterized protein DUF4185